MFFFKQNYRLTIIHSQTLQLSCNSFKLSQETYQLYLSNLSILSILTVKTPQFSSYNSSLNPISFFKLSQNHPKSSRERCSQNLTHPSNICTLYPKCIYICFSLYILYLKQKSIFKLFIPHYQQYHIISMREHFSQF